MILVLALSANAGGKDELQRYFSDAASRVQATDNPSEKRQISNESFQTMQKALDMVQQSPAISKANGEVGTRSQQSIRRTR